jgi:nitrate reductase delta subunit
MDGTRQVLRLLSVCLSFPDERIMAGWADIEAAVAGLRGPAMRERLAAFTALLKAQPLLDLQEHYTAVFDLNPQTSLNLTYHVLGDGEDRGRALAGLVELYHRSGFEPNDSELPDYLPMMLEFLAASPEAAGDARVARCLSILPGLLGRLKENGSTYAAALEILCELFPATADTLQPRANGHLPEATGESDP